MPRWVQFLIFFSLMLVVFGGAHIYVYGRLVSALAPLTNTALWVARLVTLGLVLSFPLAHFLVRVSYNPLTRALDVAASTWMGIFLYVLLCTLALHAASGLMSLSGPGRQVIAAAGPSSGLWGLALVLAVSGAIAGFAFREARREILPTELEVTFKNLPPRLDGFTIVQVSDIHLGVIVGKAQLRRMVDQVNSLHPDLIVLTGDLVDEDAGYLNSLAHELSKLQAKYGVLACTGNHEFYAGIEKVMRQVAPTGVRYLRNEKVTIADALDVYGVDDPTAWQMNHGEPLWPRDVIGQEAKQRPSLLLYHQPLHYDDAARRGIDLVLSGHTHHGQLWPLGYISKLVYRYTTGFFSIGATRAYVSRGFGTWGPPMRFGSPPEIVRVRVRAASR